MEDEGESSVSARRGQANVPNLKGRTCGFRSARAGRQKLGPERIRSRARGPPEPFAFAGAGDGGESPGVRAHHVPAARDGFGRAADELGLGEPRLPFVPCSRSLAFVGRFSSRTKGPRTKDKGPRVKGRMTKDKGTNK